MRPQIEPGLLAGLLEAAPTRVRRRLDAEPGLAEAWEWTASGDGWEVAAGAEVVRLGGARIDLADQVGCSCLLTPRCIHLLSVVSLLDAAEAGEVAAEEEENEKEVIALTESQFTAVRLAGEAGARLLAAGAYAAGSLVRADLLRAAHATREAGLHRLAAAATAVAAGVRDLGADRPSFDLGTFAADLSELLAVAHRLARHPSAEDVGTARRTFRPVGSLRLYGLFSEAVLAATGYAGVVTHLADDTGRLWKVSDVAPGGPERVLSAYRGVARLGRLAVGHHDLGRSGVYAQGLTAGPDGRLGGGEGADAARMGGTSWDEPPLRALWERPQTVGGLVFLEATVLGMDQNALVLETGDGARLRATVPEGTALARVAALGGEKLKLIGRADSRRPRTLSLLAVASSALDLADDKAARVNLGLDEIPGAAVPRTQRTTIAPEPYDDPLAGLRRILHRAAVGGRITLGSASARGLAIEAGRLREAGLATGAALLGRLGEAAAELERTVTGESRASPPEATALAWLTCMSYLEAAHRTLVETSWQDAFSFAGPRTSPS
ncbi:MAG: hypothetical protein ABIS86_08060 [Streptosporangiaceae bacterium]